MPSGPIPFDDEDGIGPHHDRPERDDHAAGSPPASTPRSVAPNYLFRRAVVVGGVVAVLATASIVIGQLMGSGGDETTSGAIAAEWNRIVLVDQRTGRVVVADADGDELARIESGVRAPVASGAVDSTLVVAGPSAVAVVDVGDESVEEFELGAETIVRPAGSALTMIAPGTSGDRALLVHGPSGDVIDTDTFAPVVGARYEFADARSSASGRDVLVTDSGNFQSVLFSFDRDEPSFFPGLALAVDADLVVTAQNVGTDATVNVFDHAGEPVATGRTPSVRAGMITDAGVVLVTADGRIVTMSSSNGETSEGVQLDLGTVESGAVTTGGDRLVVSGAAGTAIVGDGGGIVVELDDARPAGAGQPPAGSTCITTVDIALDMTGDTEAPISVIDLADGDVVAEATGTEPLLADASGCIVATPTTDGFDVVGADGVRRFPDGDVLLAVSLDGARVAAERDNRIVLVRTDDEGSPEDDPLDLGPRGRSVHFTAT